MREDELWKQRWEGHLCRPVVQRQESRYRRNPEFSLLFLSLSLLLTVTSLSLLSQTCNTPISGLPGMRRIPKPTQEPLHPLCLEALKVAGGLSHVPWEKISSPLLHPGNPPHKILIIPVLLFPKLSCFFIHKFTIGIDLKNHLLQTLHFTHA